MEAWKDVQGYEGLYQVSDQGRVRSLDRIVVDASGKRTHKRGCVLRPLVLRHGYHSVALWKDGKMKRPTVHRLVALAFVPNPDHLPEVNHRDGCKDNNAAVNLEWCTRRDNVRHEFDTGLCRIGRLTDEQVRAIRADNRLLKEIAKDYGLSESTVCNIRKRHIYRRVL